MCTVSFLPQDKGFILTSNRDESVNRKQALSPRDYFINNKTMYFPKDMEGQGTWIATTKNDFTLCLLNGAFEPHISKPPYIKSRGLVLVDFFKFESCLDFIKNYPLDGIEPFTLIVVGSIQNQTLEELRWDGDQLHHIQLDYSRPYIWSSATLYSKETILARELWFKDWLQKHQVYSVDEILFFHHFAGNGKIEENVLMKGSKKRTVSITSISNKNDSKQIVYEDLIIKKLNRIRIF